MVTSTVSGGGKPRVLRGLKAVGPSFRHVGVSVSAGLLAPRIPARSHSSAKGRGRKPPGRKKLHKMSRFIPDLLVPFAPAPGLWPVRGGRLLLFLLSDG